MTPARRGSFPIEISVNGAAQRPEAADLADLRVSFVTVMRLGQTRRRYNNNPAAKAVATWPDYS